MFGLYGVCSKDVPVVLSKSGNWLCPGGIMFSMRSFFCSCALYILFVIGTAGTALAAADTVTTVSTPLLSGPSGIAARFADVYIADTGNNRIVNKDGSVVIGSGTAGYLDGALGTAQFNAPTAIAVDKDGNLYIADTGNNRLRKVDFSKVGNEVSTVAGDGTPAYTTGGSSASAINASLNAPTGVAVDADGVVYIADSGNSRIRRVTVSGVISTIAGDGNDSTLTAYGLALAPNGDLYIADRSNHRILKIVAASLGSLSTPTVFAGTGTVGFSGDGGLATLAKLSSPSGIATNGTELYITDTSLNCIRKISLVTNVISTRVGALAQNPAIIATLLYPNGIALDLNGDLYVADYGNNVVKQVSKSTSAITTISPVGGTYTQDQKITLTTKSQGTVPTYTYYTTDGTDPLTSGTHITYSSPFTISTTTTIKYASVAVDGTNPEVTNIATYVVSTTAPTTTAAPIAGTYYSAQTAFPVTLTSDDPTAAIYYTKDGTTPTVSSTGGTGTVSLSLAVPSTSTVKYFAVNSYGNTEAVKSTKYVLVSLATTAAPAAGVYAAAQVVKLTTNDTSSAVKIYYTTDGSTPTTSSTLYSTGISISVDTTLKYFAVDVNGFSGAVTSQVYTFDSVKPVTTIDIPGGSYNSTQTVTLSSTDPTASIYYSMTGTAPAISTATKYSTPITISKTTTLMFFAVDPAGNKESVHTESYIIDTAAPATTASLAGGTFASAQTVSLSTSDPTATIYYTLDGSTPTTASATYSGTSLSISKTTTLKYFAVDAVGNAEAVKTQTYTIITLATTASPASGTFSAAQTVALVNNEASINTGVSIYYTLDGTTPTTSSKKYTAPFRISETTTSGSATTVLQFFAVDKAGVVENVKSEIYSIDSIVPTTTATCVVNAVAPLNTVKLVAADSADQDPRIKYKLYGGALTDYTQPFAISTDSIVKFFAVDAAGNTEQIKTGYCPIDAVNPKPAIYLETLANGATTSNGILYIRGNVAPVKTTTLTIQQNGGPLVTVTPSTTDGSFSTSLTLAAGANTIVIVATDSATTLSTAPDSRTITYTTPGTTPTTITIGSSNGVKGNAVKLPVTFTSGYQAAAVEIDIAYDTTQLSIPSAVISPLAAAAGKTVSTGTPSAGVFKIAVMDSGAVTPIPDGEIVSVTFGIASAASGSSIVANTSSAADIGKTTLATTAVNGAVNVRTLPGDSDGNGSVSIAEVLSALYMLLDPVTYPVDGAMDLNADGVVSISELQQAINSLLYH